MEYEFKLTYKVPENADADGVMNRLAEVGCTDALVGFGVAGLVGLEFIREAASAEAAILSAVDDVKRALPEARLVEAGPDFVGLTDVAELLGFSRQNIRKLWLNNEAAFPSPVHAGTASVWHLAQILQFLSEKKYDFADAVRDVSQVTMKLNIARQRSMVSDSELEQVRRYAVF